MSRKENGTTENGMLSYIKDSEQVAFSEFSKEEILKEIYQKFEELRKSLKVGETAHLLIDSQLFEKLKSLIGVSEIGQITEMPMKFSHPNNSPVAKEFLKTHGTIINSDVAVEKVGEFFTLPTADKNSRPISCIVMPVEQSEQSILKEHTEEKSADSVFLEQLSIKGLLGIMLEEEVADPHPFIYLAQLRDGVFRILPSRKALEKINLN